MVKIKNALKKSRKEYVLVFLCNEQAPLLIARIAAYDFVAPTAHNSMIVVICEFLKLIFKTKSQNGVYNFH